MIAVLRHPTFARLTRTSEQAGIAQTVTAMLLGVWAVLGAATSLVLTPSGRLLNRSGGGGAVFAARGRGSGEPRSVRAAPCPRGGTSAWIDRWTSG